MNIFGVGTPEIMVLALAALLIFGPGKMPEVMGQAGKWVRQFREMTAEYQGDFQKTIAEARSAVDDITKELGPMQQQVNSITSSVKKDLNSVGGSTTTAPNSATPEPAKAAGTATSRSATRTTTATKSTATSSSSASSTTSTSSTTSDTNGSTSAATVASKDEPTANLTMFEQPERTARRRSRTATPSAISDRTQRADDDDYARAMEAPVESADVSSGDALSRARRRRHAAGYNHARAV